jgi:glycosyltransferase involved in cell wall biosynthesis
LLPSGLTRQGKMRIGIDYTAAVRQRAGIGRYTRNLVRALVEIDVTNHYLLFVADPGSRSKEEGWPPNFEVRGVPLSDRWLHILWQRMRIPIPIQLVTGKLDLFHSPDFVLPPVGSVPALVTVHDLSFLRVPECFVPGFAAYLHSAVSRAVRQAVHIVADSKSTRRDLVELLGVDETRITVVYPGVEPRFRPVNNADELARVRATYRLPAQFVLGLGTLQPRKNFVRLIEAFAQALRTAPAECQGLDLVIVGERGWMYDDILLEASTTGVRERVHLVGFVADEHLPALYSLASVFAFPSLYEGFGLPILEAMACGVPVAAADNSSLAEVAGKAAVFFDAHDETALAKILIRLQSDVGLRERLVVAGLLQAAGFSWSRVAGELLGLYEALGRSNATGHPSHSQ